MGEPATISGQVLAAGVPLPNSTVILWSASAGAPRELARARTGLDGRFTLNEPSPGNVSLYIVAQGSSGHPATTLMTVLGPTPPRKVVVNEFTTIASVWTHNQFLNGTAIQGHPLGLMIAAGNVPNLVGLQTGGWGAAILDANNSTQTPTMSNFATLAIVTAACAARVKADACENLFAAATPPTGKAPTHTLAALQAIARYPAYKPERVFGLLDQFYPVPQGKKLRQTPAMSAAA